MTNSATETFREIVSGNRRGISATLARAALSVAKHPYRLVVGCRNWRYDHGHAETHRVDVPVVSIGNLTVGGTGKTPMVAWVARWFRKHNVRVALVSRGYGAESGTPNDEARELAQRLPDCPHLQAPDRVRSSQIAIDEFETQLILLDDGFQHRRLERDLDIVLVDATQPFGYGHVLPRGLLREPISSLRRANVVALTRANLIEPSQRETLRRELKTACPNGVHIEVHQRANQLLDSTGATLAVESLLSKPIRAFCGIGNPAAFRQTLLELGFQLTEFTPLPDHHMYDSTSVAQLSAAIADDTEAAAVICTHKDLVKLTTQRLGNKPLYALTLELDVVDGLPAFEGKLTAMLSRIDG